MRLFVPLSLLALLGCQDSDDSSEHGTATSVKPSPDIAVGSVTGSPVRPSRTASHKPTSTISSKVGGFLAPEISNEFVRLVNEQHDQYRRLAPTEVNEIFPPSRFTISGAEVRGSGKMYMTLNVCIWYLTDASKLLKVSIPTMRYLDQTWKEKAALLSLEPLDITPKMVSRSATSILPGCEIRSFVMDRVPGESLFKFFGRMHSIDTKLVSHVGRLSLLALEKLHSVGLLHGDIHFGNIMYNVAADEVKLIDFGRANTFIDSRGKHVTQTSVALDSILNPVILSPNELKGLRTSRADDIFRLAETLIFLIEGSGAISSGDPDTREILLRKQNRVFSAAVPKDRRSFYEAALHIEYQETPDYAGLASLLFKKI